MARHHAAFLIAVVSLVAAMAAFPVPAGAQDYWPTDAWRTSPPEEQGMRSDTLAALIEGIHAKDRKIRNIMVIRNGYVVVDASFSPYPGDTPHIIHSCTKTITGALIGIAIEKGYIESVDEKVLDVFHDKKIDNRDAAKEQMTIEHLLTMSTGFDCRDSYLYEWAGIREMASQVDWAGYVLDIPMIHEPGELFEYCNGASYLLTAILQKTTGETALGFARENLFGPLGITDIEWRMSPDGVNTGWGNMVMRPSDLAKIGYLFLKKGEWDGKQIVSRRWIEETVRPHIAAGTLSDSYGYQIWPNDMGYYMMLGFGGQYVIVHPEKNMVTVFTSCLESRQFYTPRRLYQNFVLLAAVSDEPLPSDDRCARRLAAVIDEAASPRPQPVPPLPPVAMEITGKRFEFDANAAGFNWIQLDFAPGESTAKIGASFGGQNVQAEIGLDGVYRASPSGGLLQAYIGRWINKKKFLLEFEALEQTRRGQALMTFDGNVMSMHFLEVISGADQRLTARTTSEH